MDWLLIYLGLPSANNYIHNDAIRVQYSLFFFYMENKENLKEFYSFEPYLYGPSSLDIFEDLEELQKRNLISKLKIKFDGPFYYVLTFDGDGHIKAKKLIKQDAYGLVNKLTDVKQKVTKLSFLQLLELVYIQYPEYARNSLISLGAMDDINLGVGM